MEAAAGKYRSDLQRRIDNGEPSEIACDWYFHLEEPEFVELEPVERVRPRCAG
jgi:hypothetical protein